MRSIQARFKQQEKITPSAGAYVNLQRAIKGQRFLFSEVKKAFIKFVPKDDYLGSERTGLLNWLDIVNSKPRKPSHT